MMAGAIGGCRGREGVPLDDTSGARLLARGISQVGSHRPPGRVFKVRDYAGGAAIGDGRRDASPAAQAAIDAAAAAGGGRVLFDDGVFLLGDLVLASRVWLAGGGGWTTKLVKKRGATYVVSVNPGAGGTPDPADNASTIVLADLWIEGRAAFGFSEHAHAINLNAVSDALIQRCKVTAFEGDGIYLGSSNVGGVERHNERIRIVDCVFDGVNRQNRNGISVIDGTDVEIAACEFTRCSRPDMPGAIDVEPDAHAFSRIRNIRIVGNVFHDVGGGVGAISLVLHQGPTSMTAPAFGVVIEGNRIADCAQGIHLSQREGVQPGAAPVNAIVRANQVERAGRGVAIAGIKGALLEENTFRDCPGDPLVGFTSPTDRCEDVTFRHNLWDRVSTASGNGLSIFSVDRLTMDGELFVDVGRADGSFGYAIDFNAGQSRQVSLSEVRILSPTGRTRIAIQKEPTHIFAPSTNSMRDCELSGLPSNFEVVD